MCGLVFKNSNVTTLFDSKFISCSKGGTAAPPQGGVRKQQQTKEKGGEATPTQRRGREKAPPKGKAGKQHHPKEEETMQQRPIERGVATSAKTEEEGTPLYPTSPHCTSLTSSLIQFDMTFFFKRRDRGRFHEIWLWTHQPFLFLLAFLFILFFCSFFACVSLIFVLFEGSLHSGKSLRSVATSTNQPKFSRL